MERSWAAISPDLTREDPGVPPNLDEATGRRTAEQAPRRRLHDRAVAAEGVPRLVGTDDGYIQLTRDDGDVAERDAAGPDAVEQGGDDGRRRTST